MFRPCIDLHHGLVKQVVGATVTSDDADLETNFTSDRDAAHFAAMFRADGLVGGHVIRLGPGNDEAATGALHAYPGGLQLGGAIDAANAIGWLEAGASHVIVTSWLFVDGALDRDRLRALAAAVPRDRLVIDLSCRRVEDRYVVYVDRWQTPTDLTLSHDTFEQLAAHCDEFLVHAVDVEGRRSGVDLELVDRLAEWSPITVTYAGGANSIDDLAEVSRRSGGAVHLTIGSALDIFGGDGVAYRDAVEFNRGWERSERERAQRSDSR